MYNPPTYLSKKILIDVLKEFDWAKNYEIRDEDCISDSILVRFPKCILLFHEGFESEMRLFLSNPLSSVNKYWTSFEVIRYIYAPILEKKISFSEPIYNNFFFPFASKEKVVFGLKDLCISIQTYLLPCINGDFSWEKDLDRLKELKG